MPELRLNLITGEWVVVQCERARSPESFRQKGNSRFLPDHDPSCPFCIGHEEKTPDEIMRIADDGEWKVRVAPNKFPAVLGEGERIRSNEGLRHLITGVGRHEVIIESPLHNTSLALMEVKDVARVMGVYRERFLAAFGDDRVEHVIIFKNHGPSSGTTIRHPHSQLIAIPVTPIGIRNRVEEARRFFDSNGECMMCAILADELSEGQRVVYESEHFVSLIPYAALSAFHTWVVPKSHVASFGECTEEVLSDMAQVMKVTLAKLYEGLDDPDYNLMMFSQGPFRHRSEYLHWYVSIIPRVMPTAGFELGSGMYVNPTIPEDVAKFLRDIRVS